MSYLVLHIDLEFIVGIVHADNGTSFTISSNEEELLWLYFFNNPHQNTISYGKANKIHFNNSELNYYGNFLKNIEKTEYTFEIRGITYPIINLLKESGLIGCIQKTYQEKIIKKTDNIPTLITFSSSINNNVKQKIVEYLTQNGFDIKSYTIPLSELVSYYSLTNNNLNLGEGKIALFLEATNSNLQISKLTYSDNYFLMDDNQESYLKEGMGIDPRKRAILNFVVNEVNKTTGILLTKEEIQDECVLHEIYADDWLRRLDAQQRNIPLKISSVSFTKARNIKKDVLVRKENLESDIGSYAQDLIDIFEAYRVENIKSVMTAVFFIGNCFENKRIKEKFKQMVGTKNLYFYSNRDIQKILTVYPNIDIDRYTNQEDRIKERAKIEERKLAEQSDFEEKIRIKEEKEKQRLIDIKIKEQNIKKAESLFEQAVGLEKAGKLEEAKINIENAIDKDKDNSEYQRLQNTINDKLNELKIRTEQYKYLLNKAEKHIKNKDFENALNSYELAKIIFDNQEIRNLILETNEKVKQQKKHLETIEKIFGNAKSLYSHGKLAEAKGELNKLLKIELDHKEAINLLKLIDIKLNEIEIQFKNLIFEADNHLNESRYLLAKNKYNEALKIRPNDEYCLRKLKEVADIITSPPPPPPPNGRGKSGINSPINVPPPPPPTPKNNEPDKRAVVDFIKTPLPPPPPPKREKNDIDKSRNNFIVPPVAATKHKSSKSTYGQPNIPQIPLSIKDKKRVADIENVNITQKLNSVRDK